MSKSPFIHQQDGFTLFELVTSLALFSIVSVAAMVSFSDLIATFDRFNARAYIIQDLKRAQADAVTEGCRGVFKIAADGRSYTYGCDYLSYDLTSPPSSDVTSLTRNLPANVTITVSNPIIFNSRGQAVDSAFILNTVNISLKDRTTQSIFANGVLMGTGVFRYE